MNHAFVACVHSSIMAVMQFQRALNLLTPLSSTTALRTALSQQLPQMKHLPQELNVRYWLVSTAFQRLRFLLFGRSLCCRTQ